MLGKIFKKRRIELQLRVEDCAIEFGFDPDDWKKLEANRLAVDSVNAKQICEALGINTDDLFVQFKIIRAEERIAALQKTIKNLKAKLR